MKSKSLKYITGVSILALASPAAWAQSTPGGADIAPVSHTQSSSDHGLGEIVVTARRVSENAQKVPLAITTLGEGALRESKVLSIRDLQGNAPSLYVTTGTGGPSAANIAIRGQSQADVLLVTDPSVAVYLNEINLPRQVGLRSAFLDLDQVEVLKGPQGTLFGKNTTGGALLLRTKRPDLIQPGGFAAAQMGNLGALQLSGAVNVPLVTDTLALRVAAQFNARDGFARDGLGRKLGDQNDRTARATLLFKPSSSFSMLTTADYTRSRTFGSDIVVTRLNPLAFTPAGVPANSLASVLNNVTAALNLPHTIAGYTQAYDTYAAQTVNRPDYYNTLANEDLFADLQLYGFSNDAKLDLGGVTVRSITGYRNVSRNDKQDYDLSSFSILRPRLYVYSHQFTQELQLLGNSTGPLTWIVGAFYSDEKGDEGSVTPQLIFINPGSPNITDYTAHNRSYAAFAQGTYALTPTLRATAGLRYTKVTQDVNSRNRNALGCLVPVSARPDPAVCSANFSTGSAKPSYLASLDWQASPDILVYAKTSSSFRGGGINVRGQSTTSVAPFASFGPEKATDYEVGLKGELFGRHLRLNLAGYYTDYTGIQKSTLTFVNNTTITVVSNAARGKIYGAELELTARPTQNLTIKGSASWTHARYSNFIEANGNNRTGEAFPVPEWQYSVSGKYTVPVGSDELSIFAAWRWQGTVTFKAEAADDPSVSQPKFGLLEGRIAYRLGAQPNVEFGIFAKNLLDKRYITNASNYDTSLGYNIGFVGDPRVVGVDLRIAFGGG